MAVLCPGSAAITGLDLGVYAALMQQADVVIANDTGPGHLAAAAGARLISVQGPASIAKWRPLGSRVTLLQSPRRWPLVDEVLVASELNRRHEKKAARVKAGRRSG